MVVQMDEESLLVLGEKSVRSSDIGVGVPPPAFARKRLHSLSLLFEEITVERFPAGKPGQPRLLLFFRLYVDNSSPNLS